MAAEVQDTLAVTELERLAALLGKQGPDRLVLARADGSRFMRVVSLRLRERGR